MASTSECTSQLEELKLSDISCTMGGSDESASLPAPASRADHATTSSSFICAQSGSRVEEQIEHSKVHWSLLAEPDCNEVKQCRPRKKKWQRLVFCCSNEEDEEVEEVAEVSNVEVFQALQMHPKWGSFFCTFDEGELVMGQKFAEGGQAELHEAQVKWWSYEENEKDLERGTKYVLKVFKKGTFLKHLKSQLPHGLLQFHVEEMENLNSATPMVSSRYFCHVHRGTLLKDGRFAFVMEKEHFDLRNQIERNMKLRSGKNQGPFLKDEAEYIMHCVALEVHWLHNYDIVHRNLEASNVLMNKFKSGWPKWNCVVADYECSIGNVETEFFKILQACKEEKLNQNPELFSKATDVYSFGMTCYEVFIGKLPFEDHPLNNNYPSLIDLVINQHLRTKLLEYVEDWTRELLNKCWQSNPIARPTFEEILSVLSSNLAHVKRYENYLKGLYGEQFRFGFRDHIEI